MLACGDMALGKRVNSGRLPGGCRSVGFVNFMLSVRKCRVSQFADV
jgi:hypothetical protein